MSASRILLLLCALGVTGASAQVRAADAPALTGVAVEKDQFRLFWSTGLDRYIVEQFDPVTGHALAIGTSSGKVEAAATVSSVDPGIGFFRLRSGVQAIRITDDQLDKALRGAIPNPKLAPTNWLYDVDVAGLTNLSVALRGVTTLAGLADLNDLVWFDLGGNELTSLAELAACPDIQVLRVDGNQLISVAGIESLTSLLLLDVSHNQLADLSPVAALAQIEVLYADENVLTSVDFAAGLLNLRILDLSGNQITSIAPLLANAQAGGLGTGDEVYLGGNPLADEGEVATLRGYGVTVHFP